MSPSRQKERALNARADRLLDGLRGSTLANFNPATQVLLVGEGIEPVAAHRETLPVAWAYIGIGISADVLAAMARPPNPTSVCVLVAIDGWVTLRWLKSHVLSRGGSA